MKPAVKNSSEKGKNLGDILEMNRSVILRTIKRKGICSRAELAAITGLQKASVTKIIAALMELDIVKEVGLITHEKNRRSIGLSINANLYKVLGVKFARGAFSVGLFDISGKTYSVYLEDIDMHKSPHEAIARVKAVVRDYLSQEADIVAVGVAVPGPYLRDQGRIAMMTGFPGWEKINFKQELIEAFDVPVYIEHDANAAVLAEWWFGEHGDNVDTMAHLIASEGVGAGVIHRGHLLYGAQGIAGEVGHISIDVNGIQCECGNRGCLEKYCSSIALLDYTKELLAQHPTSPMAQESSLTLDLFFTYLDAGDAVAIEAFRHIAYYLGCGIVTIINAYNPNVIVISDYLARGGPLLLEVVNEVVKTRVWKEIADRVQIKLSRFPDDPILYGAMALATDKVLKLPTRFSDVKNNVNGSKQ